MNNGTYCGVMVIEKAVTDELQRNRGLADAAVAQYHDLVDAQAARRARGLPHAPACLALAPCACPCPLRTSPARLAVAVTLRNTAPSSHTA